jgi:hypothetical protein
MHEPREPEILDEALWKFVAQIQKSRFFGITELHWHDGVRLQRLREL